MKSGFYVSMCGQHIIEINFDKTRGIMYVDFTDSYIQFNGLFIINQVKIMLSCWRMLK